MLAFDLLRKSMPCIIKLRGNGCCYGSNDFVGLTYSNKIKKSPYTSWIQSIADAVVG